MAAQGQALLEPPFNLRWGDNPERLIEWSSENLYFLNIKLPAGQPEMRELAVKGKLSEDGAEELEAKYLNGGLFEVVLHFGHGELDAMRKRFDLRRRELVHQHGPMLPNLQERSAEDGYVTRKQAFHCEPVRGLLVMMVWTELEDRLRGRTEASFSIVWRNENLRKELAARLDTPLPRSSR